MKIGNHKLSLISSTHYMKLFYRSILFLIAAAVYVIGRVSGETEPFGEIEEAHWLLNMIWIVYAVEMVLRFFPSKTEYGLSAAVCEKLPAYGRDRSGNAALAANFWRCGRMACA